MSEFSRDSFAVPSHGRMIPGESVDLADERIDRALKWGRRIAAGALLLTTAMSSQFNNQCQNDREFRELNSGVTAACKANSYVGRTFDTGMEAVASGLGIVVDKAVEWTGLDGLADANMAEIVAVSTER